MALSIQTIPVDDASLLVKAVGEVDVSCASELRDAIDAALAGEATTVVLDLAEVPYIDSTGIGVLVGAAQRAAQAGIEFAVRNPQRNVLRVLDMLGITSELGVTTTDA